MRPTHTLPMPTYCKACIFSNKNDSTLLYLVKRNQQDSVEQL